MATIRTAASKVLATVAAFGRVKEGQYGAYQSVLFEGEGLPDGKVWRCLEPEQAQQFRRGQQCHLVPTTNKQGKPSYDIELLKQIPATAPASAAGPQQQTGLTDDGKRAIAAYVEEMGSLYAYCLDTAQTKIGASSDAETVRCMASSLFISAQQKFGLA